VTTAKFGALIGGGLAITWAAFGFWVFVGVAAATLAGWFVARIVSGELDPARLADALRGRRSSS
jgi:hypothetical protein